MPKKPDYSDLVAIVDIARKFSEINGETVTTERVSMWLNRHGQLSDPRRTIPLPEVSVGGRRLYSWRKFSAWGRRNGVLKQEPGRLYDDMQFDVTDRFTIGEKAE